MQMHVFAVIASEPKTDIFGRCPQLYFPVFENEELKCREPVIVSVLRGERQKRMPTRRCDSCCDFLFAAIFYCRRHRLGFAIWRIRRRGGVFGQPFGRFFHGIAYRVYFFRFPNSQPTPVVFAVRNFV